MNRHNFKIGDTVTVYNRTLAGKFIIEGKALIKRLLQAEDFYSVTFLNEQGAQYNRYVDPNGQENPATFLETLNQNI